MKIGLIQGRLSPPIDNQIQEFPSLNWEEEFKILKKLNLNHIEWIFTEKFKTCLSKELSIESYKDSISSICFDSIIADSFVNCEWLRNELNTVVDFAVKNKIYNITVPLLEKSSIKNLNLRKQTLKIFCEFSTKDINFSFETDLNDPFELLDFIETNSCFSITYDTGNMTSEKVNHSEYIKTIYKYIKNIHLKDRNINNNTVFPGSGETNFQEIFSCIKQLKYDKLFTMQFARGETGKEIETVLSQKDFITKKWELIK